MPRSSSTIAFPFVLLAAFFGAATARAQTIWYVDNNAVNDPGPGDPTISDPLENGTSMHPFDAIQEGINASGTGDTVMILNGVYTGVGNRDVDFLGKAITVRSANGAANCLIYCEGAGRGFQFQTGESSSSILDGVAILVGNGVPNGDSILCFASSPTIANCMIIASDNYGVLCDNGAAPTIVATRVEGSGGSGLEFWFSGGLIDRCVLVANNGAGYSEVLSGATLTQCLILNNAGEGVWSGEGSVNVESCLIAGNSGAGVSCYETDLGPHIYSSIVWGNSAPAGPEIEVIGEIDHSAQLYVSYCDVRGGQAGVSLGVNSTLHWGVGNIASNPLFVDADGSDNDPNTWEDNDYHLSPGSPCVDAGDPSYSPGADERDFGGHWRVWDGDSNGSWLIDIGPYEYESQCLGDIGGDGVVGLSDLATLLANYGTTSGMTPEHGDFDWDGDVDLADLSALLAAYGQSCP